MWSIITLQLNLRGYSSETQQRKATVEKKDYMWARINKERPCLLPGRFFLSKATTFSSYLKFKPSDLFTAAEGKDQFNHLSPDVWGHAKFKLYIISSNAAFLSHALRWWHFLSIMKNRTPSFMASWQQKYCHKESSLKSMKEEIEFNNIITFKRQPCVLVPSQSRLSNRSICVCNDAVKS